MSPPGGPQVYKRSTDAGRSWSKLQTLLDPIKMFPPSQCPTDSASVRSENTSCVFWDPTPIVDRQKGAVFLLTTRSWAHDGMTGFASRENSYMDMWAVKSTDVGRVSTHPTPPPRARVHPKVPRSTCPLTSVALPQTWSEPKNITSQVWNAQQHTPALNNGHGIQTSTGRLIAPACARPDAVIPAMHMKEHSAIVYSDDHVRSHPPTTSTTTKATTTRAWHSIIASGSASEPRRCLPGGDVGFRGVVSGRGGHHGERDRRAPARHAPDPHVQPPLPLRQDPLLLPQHGHGPALA